MLRTLRIAASILALTALLSARVDADTIDLNWGFGSHHGTVAVRLGDTVRWTWTDGAPHTVTAQSGAFSSGIHSGTGYQYSFTFTELGSFYYFCSVHGAAQMDGTIYVTAPVSVESASWGGIKALYR